jgi:hypothetical protein
MAGTSVASVKIRLTNLHGACDSSMTNRASKLCCQEMEAASSHAATLYNYFYITNSNKQAYND